MDGWKAGDLALCIISGTWFDDVTGEDQLNGPQEGEVCLVTDVLIWKDVPALVLKEWPDPEGWAAYAFRKIQPDTEPADEGFCEFIKTMDQIPELV